MPPSEISIDLTAQELLAPPELTDTVQVEDIGEIDPALRTGAFTANDRQTAAAAQTAAAGADDSMEIELTADQMDAVLGKTRTGR